MTETNNTPTPPPTEGWEREFEKTFVLQNYWKSDDESTAFADIERVKSFIRKTITKALAEQKARMIEVVEGFKGEDLLIDEVVDDIINALKKENEN